MDQQTYYGKTDYSSDKAGAAALADEKNQIDSKQQQVTDAEKKVADLQAQLDAANKSSK
jgi:Fe-S-cluster formation regulator IscX/YfhJ